MKAGHIIDVNSGTTAGSALVQHKRMCRRWDTSGATIAFVCSQCTAFARMQIEANGHAGALATHLACCNLQGAWLHEVLCEFITYTNVVYASVSDNVLISLASGLFNYIPGILQLVLGVASAKAQR